MGCISFKKLTRLNASLYIVILIFVSIAIFGNYRIQTLRTTQTFLEQGLYQAANDTAERSDNGFKTNLTYHYLKLSNVLSMIRQSWLQGRKVNGKYFDEEYSKVHMQMRSVLDEIRKERIADLSRLSAEIQKKLWIRQNPANCEDVRLLVLDFEKFKAGFGSLLHAFVLHFLQALYTNRTLAIRSNSWVYGGRGSWERHMMPLGKCMHDGNMTSIPLLTDANSEDKIVKSNRGTRGGYAKYAWKIPRNVYSTLLEIYSEPYTWWIGQFVKYAFRFQPWFEKKLRNKSKLINFTDSTIGLQIRWGDKINTEARKHPIDEYMDFAELWYGRKENRELKRSIYVATEESQAWEDLEYRKRNYTFIGGGFVDRSKELEYRKRNNYTGRANEMEAILTDFHFLSKCRYVVCTYSSNICRMLYELAAVDNDEPQDRIQSLDDKMYWLLRVPRYMTIDNHVAENKEDIDMAIGDEFIPSHENFKPSIDGYLRGKNVRTHHIGRVPMHKLKSIVSPLDFDL